MKLSRDRLPGPCRRPCRCRTAGSDTSTSLLQCGEARLCRREENNVGWARRVQASAERLPQSVCRNRRAGFWLLVCASHLRCLTRTCSGGAAPDGAAPASGRSGGEEPGEGPAVFQAVIALALFETHVLRRALERRARTQEKGRTWLQPSCHGGFFRSPVPDLCCGLSASF